MTSDLPPSEYISRLTAIDKVRQWFSAEPEADSISVADIFKLYGREDRTEKANRQWLSTMLYLLKPHDLVKPVYGPDRKIHRIQLTPEGKRALQGKERATKERAKIIRAKMEQRARMEPAEARPPKATFTGVTLGAERRSYTREYSISHQAAIKMLLRRFPPELVLSGPDADSVSVEDLFKSNVREDLDEKRNRKWLSLTLLLLKPYHLVQPVLR